ncbi:MAG TPA: hypothetical protein VNK44_01315 [Candidatus Nitrosotenuis sp.]|nr:hypothetical protein [Candidatus Nitrosotenuis sp.]
MKQIDFRLLVAIVSTSVALGAVSYHYATASHGFESGVSGSSLPNAVTVSLAGQVMRPGDYFPLVDYSPNYVAGHLLVRIPCDNNAKPLVTPIAGHVDELPERTWMAPAQLNYIPHASKPGDTCVYHSHIPAVDLTEVGNPGAPRITDIGLLNQGKKNVVFRTANVMSFTVLNVLGDINPPNHYGPGGFAKDIPGSPYLITPTFPPTNLDNPNPEFDEPHHHG